MKTADHLDSPNEHAGAMTYQADLMATNVVLADTIPIHRHILKPRSFRESTLVVTVRDAQGNYVYATGGRPRTMRRRGVREYIDYCELGDLANLIDLYNPARYPGQDFKKIPEKFIWHVFKAIMEVIHVLHHGRAWDPNDISDSEDGTDDENPEPENPEPETPEVPEVPEEEPEEERGEDPGEEYEDESEEEEWEPRLHRDIKPLNIFLRKTEWSECDVLLADFDVMETVLKSQNEDMGSTGYKAPVRSRNCFPLTCAC